MVTMEWELAVGSQSNNFNFMHMKVLHSWMSLDRRMTETYFPLSSFFFVKDGSYNS